MRPKIVVALLLAGLAGLLGIIFLKDLAASMQSPRLVIAGQEAAPDSKNASAPAPVKPAIAEFAPVVPPAVTDTNKLAEQHVAYVQAEIDKLTELQANDDVESLHAILAQLTNSDKEIRAAAVESTIQFGNRDAIPVLKDLAANTENLDEKKALLDAAEFLALPTLTEVRAQKLDFKIIPPTPK